MIVPFEPDWVSAPGDTIRELLDERGWCIMALADRLPRRPDFTAGLMAGTERIDQALAARLAEVLGGSEQFWINRDRQYVDDCARLGRKLGDSDTR